MKQRIACGLAASLVATLTLTAMSAEAGTAAACDTAAGDSNWFRRFDDGALGPRGCALRALAADELSSSTTLDGVRTNLANLTYFYERRARRQQIIVDTEAGLVVVGAIGSALATGAGATSQRAWAYATFTPAVAGQIHANEPTRDLFHGGVQALALMSRRYVLLSELNDSLAARTTDCISTRRTAIEGLLTSIRGKTAGADRDAFEREAERPLALCDALELANSQTNTYKSALDFAVGRQARQLAREVLALDHDILKRDRDLRYSPVETIGAVIASPLRTLDSVLTGENAQAALNTVKTAQAFSGLDQKLGAVRLPPAPASIAKPISMPGEVRERARRVDPALLGQFDHELATLQGLVDNQSYTASLIQEVAAAASATELTFGIDAATGRILIRLSAPAAPSPAIQP